jgi:hypothetical protein
MTQIFVTLDAGGAPVELIPTLGFTTHTARVMTPEEAAWSFTPVGERTAFLVNHAPGALALYVADDLDRFGIWVLTLPPTPEGERLAGYDLMLVEGLPVISATFEPVPA